MNRTERSRVLVAGGAGFLGSHLCRALLDAGHHVICLDNFFTGNERNLSGLLGNPRFELLRQDVTEPFGIEVDEIYNLACPASPRHYQLDPVQTTRTSVLGALNLLALARRQGARILQASTSEVYGDPQVHPQPEQYWGRVNPIGPRACYDEGKRCAETLFVSYREQHGVRIKIARIFNTYGPHMDADDGRVVSNFIVQALAGNPLTIYGDGRQTRSFCYVDDMVDALQRLMRANDAFCGPVNLGNPDEISMLELAQAVLALTGSVSPIVYAGAPPDDPARRRPDIRLAHSELGWSPGTPLHEGLARTIDYFSSLLERGAVPDKLCEGTGADSHSFGTLRAFSSANSRERPTP
jgi:UDP-glucuronate decarboxylase